MLQQRLVRQVNIKHPITRVMPVEAKPDEYSLLDIAIILAFFIELAVVAGTW